MLVWFWLAFAVVMLSVEAATVNLTSIWFAGGAVAAFLAALLHARFAAQLVVFVLVSAALLAGVRPLLRRRAARRPAATNADRLIGRLAVVSEPIDNLRATGALRVDGVEWTARTSGDEPIAEGETVRILEIRGVKAVVERVKEPVNT